ncbi:hypothetical protein GYMLUDRAFT_252883 [Collybiopsis luxurians FD-317 M1]|uniref:Uncharacterized protein n=1 Tax=Collybiopsis luxurians FD-317 M1 TaxID=944289 RepID=A0A0D0C765_9AGAR|nr:hypothetical protein GYMLUDRAFT_252883 [Collybiopsis luxurians FD-317 M1]
MADGDDKSYAAMGVTKTIYTIVNAVESSPEILEIIIPIIVYTLDAKILTFPLPFFPLIVPSQSDPFDNMYELVDSLTFKFRSVSPNMWPVLELTYKLFKNDAVDFLEEMLPLLDNHISYGADTIKLRTNYKQMLLDIYLMAITSNHLGENDRIDGCKLAKSMLLNLRGCIDDVRMILFYVAYIVSLTIPLSPSLPPPSPSLVPYTLACTLLSSPHSNSPLLEVIITCVLYNPSTSLTIMETARPGSACTFFEKVKLSIVVLASLMELEPAQIQERVREGWGGIVKGALKVFRGLPKAITDRKVLEEALAEEEDEDDFDDEKVLNMNGDDEDVWDEDWTCLEMLANEVRILSCDLTCCVSGARFRAKSEELPASDGEGDDDDESEDEDLEEELGYISSLNTVNAYMAFKNSLTVFQMRNPSGYQVATTSLTVEEQTFFMDVMRLAEQPPAAAVGA